MLVLSLMKRVNEANARQDASPVLEDEAVQEADALLARLPAQPIDVEALMAIGTLHWFRFSVLDGAAERHAGMQALRCFAPLYGVNPEAVPDELRKMFEDAGVESVLIENALGFANQALQEAEATPTVDAVNEALVILSTALRLAPEGHPRHAAALMLLAAGHRIRFERFGKPEDLDAAIAAAEDSADAVTEDDPSLAQALAVVSGLLRARFELARVPSDLERAVGVARNALRFTSPDNPLLGSHLVYLSQALQTSYDISADPAELDEALTAARRAVEAGAVNDEERARHLSALASVLRARFEATRALGDITEAVDALQDAVNLSRGTNHTIFLTLLAAALQLRFGRTDDRRDLDAAIGVMREAMDELPPEHPARPRHLATLTSALRIRAEHPVLPGAELIDLMEAVGSGRDAVAAASGEFDRAIAATNLATALRALYRLTRQPELVDEAVSLSRTALADLGVEHVGRAGIQVNLSILLRERHRDDDDLREAIVHAREVAERTSAAPVDRAIAARSWADAAVTLRDWALAIDAYERAIGLLALVAPRGAARSDQEHSMAALRGLAADAAACCLQAQRPEQALELVEAGRGVLLGQALDLQTDLAAVDAIAPELASRFQALRSALQIPDMEGEAEGRRRLAAELDTLVGRIRGLPGFERFLTRASAAELLAAAADGPVVVVNVSRIRSDALLVTAAGVRHVPLPAATAEGVRDQLIALTAALDALRDGDRAADDALTAVLAWLWDAIAGPVLTALGLTDRDAATRLWWCPTGPVALLPLHAAGHHGTRADATPQTVLDRVVSAYTPTLRALVHSRRPAAADQPADGTRLIVSMPETPGAPDLPGAAAEADALDELLDGRHATLRGREATFGRVTTLLPQARWAHFACHAASDAEEPSASRLLLHDHQTRPLTVTELARTRIEDAQLAFLSACGTARPGWEHADEAIHLAAACQLAGYRHVIATFWPIRDRAAVRIATSVYVQLVEQGEAAGAAAALAAAVREERDRSVDRPSTWASHMSYGS